MLELARRNWSLGFGLAMSRPWRGLFAAHRQRLWHMVRFRLDRHLAGRADPDDVLQEAYLAAAKRIEHFSRDGMTSGFVWLRMIVQQTLIDVHRRHMGAQIRSAGREVSLFGGCSPQSTSVSLAIHLVGDQTSPKHGRCARRGAGPRAEVDRVPWIRSTRRCWPCDILRS